MILLCLVAMVASMLTIPIRRAPVDRMFDFSLRSHDLVMKNRLHVRDFKNMVYYGDVLIGTPRRKFAMLFDTGSRSSWVASVNCKAAECVHKQKYDLRKSRSSYDMKQKFDIEYQQGPVSGDLVVDEMSLSGVTFKQTTGVATNVSGIVSFGKIPIDGVLGMGWSRPNEQQTAIDSIFRSPGWRLPHIFAFRLGELDEKGKLEVTMKDEGVGVGELSIGGYNEACFQGPLTWHPLSKAGRWAVEANHLTTGDGTKIDKHVDLEIDSGTSFILGPTYAIDRAMKSWKATCDPKQPWCSIRCGARIKLNIILESPHRVLALDERDLVFHSEKACYLRVRSIDFPQWILGDAFMRKFYSAFDMQKQQIGFALSKRETPKVAAHQKPDRKFLRFRPKAPLGPKFTHSLGAAYKKMAYRKARGWKKAHLI